MIALALLLVSSASAQEYRLPLGGVEGFDCAGGECVVTAYVDHGAGAAETDWDCGANTYDGHGGTDIAPIWAYGCPTDFPVVAAADGEVVEVVDGEADHCECGGVCGAGGGNHVILEHEDGKHTVYMHMREGSTAVSLGDLVTCGQILGRVGNTGRSSGAHLHFQVNLGGPWGASSDPFDGPCSGPPTYWVDQGAWGGLPGDGCDLPPCVPAAEVCDGVDNDCNGLADEGLLNACGACGPTPPETCNCVDDDCDGAIDEDEGRCGDVARAMDLSYPARLEAGDSARSWATFANQGEDPWPAADLHLVVEGDPGDLEIGLPEGLPHDVAPTESVRVDFAIWAPEGAALGPRSFLLRLARGEAPLADACTGPAAAAVALEVVAAGAPGAEEEPEPEPASARASAGCGCRAAEGPRASIGLPLLCAALLVFRRFAPG